MHITWGARGAISLEGLGLEVVQDAGSADFLLAHGMEALARLPRPRWIVWDSDRISLGARRGGGGALPWPLRAAVTAPRRCA